jgi:alpha-L-fucosidase
LNNTWGYKSYDHDWKSINEMIFWLVEIASKGGNYLLNVGPDGKGEIPSPSIDVLKEMGEWMATNGEAIYGTKRWITMKEGPTSVEMKSTTDRKANGFAADFTPQDFWFTAKEDAVYAISLHAKTMKTASIKSLYLFRKNIISIQLLGYKGKLTWKILDNAVYVILPGKLAKAQTRRVFKVNFKTGP